MAVNTEGQTMDPAWCATLAYDRCAPVFGTLLRYDTTNEQYIPGMAASFDSVDGKTWTLRLRPGVKFTDGTDFDAAAVAFNWERVKAPATLSPAARIAAQLSWKVVDPLTLEVTQENINFQLPRALTQGLSMIGSPTAITQLGKNFGNAPIGAGPFVLKKWTRNSQAEFTANANYWDPGLPYVDSFVLKVIGQDDQRLNALRTRQININWSLLSKDAKTIEAEGYTVHSLPLIGGTGLKFNFDDPDLKDPQLRLALQKTFDSAQINSALYPGDKPVDVFLYPGNPYRDDSRGKFPEQDLAGAQKLFDAYLAKTGKAGLTLRLTAYAGIPALDRVAQILQSQLQQIEGLEVGIEQMDNAMLQGKFRSGAYQLGLGATLSEQMDAIYEVFHSGGSANTTRYSNPKVDQALETSRTSNDPGVVTEAYKVVNGEISKDAPLRTWRYQTGYIYTPKNVKGLVIVGTYGAPGCSWIGHGSTNSTPGNTRRAPLCAAVGSDQRRPVE
ncbi:ABC transporter substrate-binding protein [Nocardia sp. NPDC051750]|uniref:ABC transporter substrate-binding protein n=1 Tax=Nocardia sp. NPDC051750 TaxID=3364325 RepID=UPI0037B49CE6